MDDLLKMRLSIISKSWNRLLDNEDDWCHRWLSGRHVLSRASLAQCGSFKSRLALVYLARKNMKESKGLLYDMVRDVNFETNSAWQSIQVQAEVSSAASTFLGYTVYKNSYQGSYSSTSLLRIDLVDISEWPHTRRKSIKLDGISRMMIVGEDFIVDTKHAKVGTVSHTLEIPADVKKPLIKMNPMAMKSFSAKFHKNSNPAYPWLLHIECAYLLEFPQSLLLTHRLQVDAMGKTNVTSEFTM
jgi:hypothetical protein